MALRDVLVRESASIGLSLSDPQCDQLMSYLGLLMKWNKRINLVGTRNASDIVVQHLVDCLAVVPYVSEAGTRLVDVGSGAGLPGAVIAMMCPELSVTALEPTHKKHAFMAAVRRELSLPGFVPLAERMETVQAGSSFEPFDIAVSRAVFSLPVWLSRSRELVKPGGLIVGMEGLTQCELPESAHRYTYNLQDRTRAIVTWRP